MWKQHSTQNNKNNYNDDEDEEPEWGEDDVTEYKNSKVSFRSIPSVLLENAEKNNSDRPKNDIYNNNAFNEEPKTLKKPEPQSKKQELILTPKEQVFKNSDDNNDNLFDQIESYLLQTKEKEKLKEENTIPTKILPPPTKKPKEEVFNPKDFFDKIDSDNNNSNNNQNSGVNYNKSGFFDSKKKKFQNQQNFNNPQNFQNFSNFLGQNQFTQNISPQQLQLLYQLKLQQLYLSQQQKIQVQQQCAPYFQMMPGQFMYPMLNYPPGYIQSPMVNMNMNMNMNFNFPPATMPPSKPQSNPEPEEDNDDDEEDNDPIMDDPNPNFAMYNPAVFLENPALIVKKNFIEPNWFLMKDNKILGNYNSEELYYFLGEKIREGEKFENVCISDYHTDLVFQPKNLYEILKDKVPKLTKKYIKSKMGTSSTNNIGMKIPMV